jgi:hypothetical membrane protein
LSIFCNFFDRIAECVWAIHPPPLTTTLTSPASEAIQSQRALLWAALAVPFLYYGTMLVSAFFYPGYNHVTQYASELGSSEARYPAIFNIGTITTGVIMIAAAAGIYRAAVAAGARRAFAGVGAVCLALFGVSLVLGGLFPMPDPRHGGFGLGLAMLLAPPALAIALWKRPELRTLARFLLADALAMLVLFAIMMGIGALVTRSNVGLFQRAYSLTVFPWVGIAGFALLRRTREYL